MKKLLLAVVLALPFGCSKSEKQADLKGNQSALEVAAADFKTRVTALETAKIENVVFSNVRHDVIRTNSVTSPLKAEVSARKIVKKEDGLFTVYDLKIFAQYRDGEWHYDRCAGKMIGGGSEIEIQEDSFHIQSAYDFVKTLRLKHDDIHWEEFK